MPYVITAPCVSDYSCVEVCPVNCIGPLPDKESFDTAEQLYINPELCIDCGACVGACPVEAIFNAWDLPALWAHYAQINSDYFAEANK